jgi:hypothetical protein
MLKFRITLAVMLGFLLAIAVVRGQTSALNQKASFLYNIAKFVEWPATSFKNPNDPVVCCLLGDGPFERKLEQLTNPQFIEKRRFLFQHAVDAAQIKGCHILFVNSSEQKRWRSLASEVHGRGVLTIGETEDFIVEGGVIRLSVENGKASIQINRDAADEEGLHISSRLLSLARIIKP